MISVHDGKSGKAKETPPDVVVWVEGIPAAKAPEARPVLSQKYMQFTPPLLVVVTGQTVDMPNDDDLAHNVYSQSPAKRFDLGIYPTGETKSVTFDQPGLIEVRCSIHRKMNARVVVVPNRHHTVAAAGHPYEIPDVPPGRYTLKAWKDGMAVTAQGITVPSRGGVAVNLSLSPAMPK